MIYVSIIHLFLLQYVFKYIYYFVFVKYINALPHFQPQHPDIQLGPLPSLLETVPVKV